jgi:hypothetical protein
VAGDNDKPALRVPDRWRPSTPAVILGAACLTLHVAFNASYGVFRDELYFIVCGRHPAFGYVDQPTRFGLARHETAANPAEGALLALNVGRNCRRALRRLSEPQGVLGL